MVDGWMGRVVKLPQGSQFGHYFERDDGQHFDIGTEVSNLYAGFGCTHPRRLLRVALR